ncbi:MAG: hypothetical protein NT040_11100 [Bacteroidetes bacterium]|nr:hypothetical protein [Bacteroidota bacterium]
MKYSLKIMVMLFMVVLSGATIGTYIGVNPMWVIGILLVTALAPRQLGIATVTLVDLARPAGNNPGAGGGIKSEILLIPEDSINWAAFPDRTLNDSTIASLPLKVGKFMKRFYMTDDVIEPGQKKIKGGNVDSGGWEISLKGFHPGWGDAVMAWIASYGYAFKGCVIIRNCADGKKYLIGEPCNVVHIDDIQSKWGSSVEKEKGHEITFVSKQSKPIAIFTGPIVYDPTSASW